MSKFFQVTESERGYGVSMSDTEMLTRFADDAPNAECHRHLIPLCSENITAKQLRQSRLPRVAPPPDIIKDFGELDIFLPDNIWVG